MLPRPAETRGRVRVGRYLVTGRIGRGGMGMVYRALDEALEREVALKTLISDGGFDSDSRKRFEVEARAAARLQHPNIVIVYELGEDRGIPFIAMEMLSGSDLEAVLRGGEPLDLVEKLDVLVQVCRGLAYAHERGIVHRDMKPSNIRLLEDGTAKIMDFGIAKQLGGTQLTKAGMMVGTVHYMSPEQVRGQPLDGRSDVFSAGVILYELLAGRRPFRGEGPTQVLYKIVHDPPAPLDLSELGGEVAPKLEAILARALAKEPDERYPSAAAIADALAAVLEEVQQGMGVPPPEAVSALQDARQALRQERSAEAIDALRTLSSTYPSLVEARRTLRAAVREQASRSEPRPTAPDEYPELEATFQATRTRREAGTQLEPTATIEPGQAQGAARLAPAGHRAWLWTGAALVALAAIATSILLRGGAPPPLRVPVRSEPSGAAVLVDGTDSGVRTNGELALRVPASGQVVLSFRKDGYREVQLRARLPLAAGETVSVVLQPLLPKLRLRTTPPGAAVTLDGQRAGASPLELALDPASEHQIAVALDGYLPQELRVGKGERRDAVELSLQPLPPPGTVAVRSGYPLDVQWHGRMLAKGELAPRVSVAGGRQVLTLVAPAVFLRAEVTVEVPSGGQAQIEAPRVGKLNVRAMPDTCEVFVDGAFVDYPPILDRPAVVGRHQVSFRWPDGSRDQRTAEVREGAPAFVVGQKP